MTDELPENVDLRWLGRTLIGFRDEMRDLGREVRHLKDEVRAVRSDLDLLVLRAMRIDTNVTALRDDIQTLFITQGDHRRRIEALEEK
jgi:predicted RNase H-like nuclease (RuvC/YqgF family)